MPTACADWFSKSGGPVSIHKVCILFCQIRAVSPTLGLRPSTSLWPVGNQSAQVVGKHVKLCFDNRGSQVAHVKPCLLLRCHCCHWSVEQERLGSLLQAINPQLCLLQFMEFLVQKMGPFLIWALAMAVSVREFWRWKCVLSWRRLI